MNQLHTFDREQPVWRSHAWIMGMLFLLILLGGAGSPISLGAALILPGVFLMRKPPEKSVGRGFDALVLVFIGSLLLACLPANLTGSAAWREEAQNIGINLPSMQSIMPWVSFESAVSVFGAIALFYVVLNLEINTKGWKRLMFYFSLLGLTLSGLVFLGIRNNWRYLGASDAAEFSFFPDPSSTHLLLAICGFAAFATAMEGMKARRVGDFTGLLTTAVCLLVLIFTRSADGVIYFFLGLTIWFALRVMLSKIPRFLKLSFAAIAIVFFTFGILKYTFDYSPNDFLALKSNSTHSGAERAAVFADSWKLFLETPLTGIGAGNFAGVFPQYQNDTAANGLALNHPESEWMWLLTESGAIALVCVLVAALLYFKRCRKIYEGRTAVYRLASLSVLLLLIVQAYLDISWHRVGIAYFGIFFAAMALPIQHFKAKSLFGPAFWRISGIFLTITGIAWMLGGLFALPTHSIARDAKTDRSIENALIKEQYFEALPMLDQAIARAPLQSDLYFKRAEVLLADVNDKEAAAADFDRARFLTPHDNNLNFAEGRAWLKYDVDRSFVAWRRGLSRELKTDDDSFDQILELTLSNPLMKDRLLELVELNIDYRARLLLALDDIWFQREIIKDLRQDPALMQYDIDDRSELVLRWIEQGDTTQTEPFLIEHGSKLKDTWRHFSVLRKNQVRYLEAVEQIRSGIPEPKIPYTAVDLANLIHLERSFATFPGDLAKGSGLLRVYIEKEEYQKAYNVVDALIKNGQEPEFIRFWHGELLYRLGDYIESWYAFESFL